MKKQSAQVSKSKLALGPMEAGAPGSDARGNARTQLGDPRHDLLKQRNNKEFLSTLGLKTIGKLNKTINRGKSELKKHNRAGTSVFDADYSLMWSPEDIIGRRGADTALMKDNPSG